MPSNPVPIPSQDAIATRPRAEFAKKGQTDPQSFLVTQPWVDYFTDQGKLVTASTSTVNTVQPANQSASIGATDISTAGLAGGLYVLSYYARIVQAATTSSSLEITLNWTDRGTAMSFTGTAMTGNTPDTFQSETKLIRADAATPIRYSATYASVGGVPMTFDLVVSLSRLGA